MEQHLGELVWIPKLLYSNADESGQSKTTRVSSLPQSSTAYQVQLQTRSTAPTSPKGIVSPSFTSMSPSQYMKNHMNEAQSKTLSRMRPRPTSSSMKTMATSATLRGGSTIPNFGSTPNTRIDFHHVLSKKSEDIEKSFQLETDTIYSLSEILDHREGGHGNFQPSSTLRMQKENLVPLRGKGLDESMQQIRQKNQSILRLKKPSLVLMQKQGKSKQQLPLQTSKSNHDLSFQSCSVLLESLEEDVTTGGKSDMSRAKSPKDISRYVTKQIQQRSNAFQTKPRLLVESGKRSIPSSFGGFFPIPRFVNPKKQETNATIQRPFIQGNEQSEISEVLSEIEQEFPDTPVRCSNKQGFFKIGSSQGGGLANSLKDGEALRPLFTQTQSMSHVLSSPSKRFATPQALVTSQQSYSQASRSISRPIHTVKHSQVELLATLTSSSSKSLSQNSFSPDVAIKHIPCLFLKSTQPSNFVLLYFHGNGEDISLSYEMTSHIRSALKVIAAITKERTFFNLLAYLYQINVLAVEYGGYGIYGGETDEDDILNDALFVYKYLTQILNFSASNILVMGRSIGSGPATWLASKQKVRCLILVSPFTSIRAVVKHVAGSLAQHLIKERFENCENIKLVECPTLIVHGQQDTLIPYSQSQALHDFCKGPCQLVLPRQMTHIELNFQADLTNPLKNFLFTNGLDIQAENSRLKPINLIRLPIAIFSPPKQ